MEDLVICVDIIWSKESQRIKFTNARIFVSNNQILVSVELTGAELKDFSSFYPAGINLYEDLGKCVEYSNAFIDGKRIKLKKHYPSATSWRCHCNQKDLHQMSWNLYDFSYTYKSEPTKNFIVLNYPYSLLMSNSMMNSEEDSDRIIVTNNGNTYEFLSVHGSNHTTIKTDAEDSIEDVLVHLSFYLNCHLDIVKTSIYKDGKTNISIQTPFFEIKKHESFHPELAYIEGYGLESRFVAFLQNSRWYSLEDYQKQTLRQAIYTLCRCQYCDVTTQFLLLYTILDNYVGNTYGKSPYSSMKKRMLELYNISIEKIGAVNDPELQKMNLYLKHDNGKEVCVSNFCLLRNYILHFMSKLEIDEYLKKSSLISRLRFAVNIIILRELGFEDVRFREDWEHLSVLNSSPN